MTDDEWSYIDSLVIESDVPGRIKEFPAPSRYNYHMGIAFALGVWTSGLLMWITERVW